MSIPKAADLPVGTVVATEDLVGIRTDTDAARYGYPWRMSHGGYFQDAHIDKMLAQGAQVLRVGTTNPVIEHLDPEESARAALALLGAPDTEENRAKVAALSRSADVASLARDARKLGLALGALRTPDERRADYQAAILDSRKNQTLAYVEIPVDEATAHAVNEHLRSGDQEAARRALLREIEDCTCVEFCAEHPPTACSLSGIPHVHPDDGSGTFGPCPVHPDRPGDH